MSETAVLVVDMLNGYRHPDAELLGASAAEVVAPLARLVRRARERDDIDVIYVNDNYGDFTADWDDIVHAALHGERPDLVEPLVPERGCLTLMKVRQSVFYASPLDYLLGRLETKRIVLTGQVTEQCILYSALDGYLRHFDVTVPPDVVAHIDSGLGSAALTMMERNMRVQLLPSADCLARPEAI